MFLIPSPLPKLSHKSQNDQKGSSLIEVLVALVLVSFGLLGLAGMLNYSIAANKSASSRMIANLLIQDYAELVRANPDGLYATQYEKSLTTFDPTSFAVDAITSANLCAFPACNNLTIAKNDMELFRARVQASLPAGEFKAARVGTTSQIDIWIMWLEGKSSVDANSTIDVCPAFSPAPDPYPRCLYMRIAI
jgi:type IV pilus assembly protein PilV